MLLGYVIRLETAGIRKKRVGFVSFWLQGSFVILLNMFKYLIY